MLGIILIYFIGKHFYNLAEEFNKNKWLFAILSVVVFYATQIVFGFILGILNPQWFDFDGNMVDSGTEMAINLIGIPIGLGGVYLFYYLMKKKWEKEEETNKPNIDDIGVS